MELRRMLPWGLAAILSLGYIWFLPSYHALTGEKERLEGRVAALEGRISGFEERLEHEASGGYETPITDVIASDLVFPVAPEDYLMLTSPYGHRRSPFFDIYMKHEGLDIAAVWRAQIVPVADGIVVEHWPPKGTPHPNGGVYQGHPIYGGMVRIRHDNGMISLSGHLSETNVHEGMRVKAGQVIGRQGSTGLADGEHLHFELYVDGKSVNPLHYLPEVPR